MGKIDLSDTKNLPMNGERSNSKNEGLLKSYIKLSSVDKSLDAVYPR